MWYCCVPDCRNKYSFNIPAISFFSFPIEPERCALWVKNIGRGDLETISPEHLYRSFRVCAEHFEDSMFASLAKSPLKKNAVPTKIFEKEHSEITMNAPQEIPISEQEIGQPLPQQP